MKMTGNVKVTTRGEGQVINFCIKCGNDMKQFGRIVVDERGTTVTCRCGCEMKGGTFNFKA